MDEDLGLVKYVQCRAIHTTQNTTWCFRFTYHWL